jgi:hypothetical protein
MIHLERLKREEEKRKRVFFLFKQSKQSENQLSFLHCGREKASFFNIMGVNTSNWMVNGYPTQVPNGAPMLVEQNSDNLQFLENGPGSQCSKKMGDELEQFYLG